MKRREGRGAKEEERRRKREGGREKEEEKRMRKEGGEGYDTIPYTH